MRPDCCPKRIRRQMARPSHVEVYRESSGLSRKLCYSLMRSSNRGTMGITLQPSRQKLIIVQVMSEPVDPFGWNLEIAEGATVDRYLSLSTNLYILWEQCINVWMMEAQLNWSSIIEGIRELDSKRDILERKIRIESHHWYSINFICSNVSPWKKVSYIFSTRDLQDTHTTLPN